MANGNALTQPQQQGSLFRRILGGALLGLSGGLSAREGQHPFTAGMEAVETARDRQLQREGFTAEQRRRDEQLALQQEQVGLERLRTEAAVDTEKAQRALLQTQLLRTQREFDLLPKDRQEALNDAARPSVSELIKQGAILRAEGDSRDALEARAIELMQESKGFDFFVLPHPTQSGKHAVIEVPRKTISEPVEVKIGRRTITVPAGSSTTAVLEAQFKAAAEELDAETQLQATRIASTARTTPQDREGLEAFRQEIATLRSRITQKEIERRTLLGNQVLTDPSSPDRQQIVQRLQQLDAEIADTEARIFDLTRQLRQGGDGTTGTGAPAQITPAQINDTAQDALVRTNNNPDEAIRLITPLPIDQAAKDAIISRIRQLAGASPATLAAPASPPPGITPETGRGVKLPIPGNVRVPR